MEIFFLFPSIVADSCAGYFIIVPMAMSEEQQVVSEVQDVSPTGGSSLMGQSHLGKAAGLQTPNVFCFCCALTCLLLLWVWRDPHSLYVVCLSHEDSLFYGAFLSVDCQKYDSSPKLYYLIDNNNDN